MLQGHDLSFAYSDDSILFQNITLSVNNEKIGLVGNNGAGKSTLLKILCGKLAPSSGSLSNLKNIQYLPQNSSIEDFASLWSSVKTVALGRSSVKDWDFAQNHWDLLTEVFKNLALWDCEKLLDTSDLNSINAGTIRRLQLALSFSFSESILLLDEPSNHLDQKGRRLLEKAMNHHKAGIIVASHDRDLLRSVDRILEIRSQSLRVYGGPYQTYFEQRRTEEKALETKAESTQKELRKVRREVQRNRERQEKRNSHGDKFKADQGLPKILLGARKQAAEATTARLKQENDEKLLRAKDSALKASQRYVEEQEIKIDLEGQEKGHDKTLLTLSQLNHQWSEGQWLWKDDIHFSLRTGERWALKGENGSGKSSLIALITGKENPRRGLITRHCDQIVTLDQTLQFLPTGSHLLNEWRNPGFISEGKRRTIAARLGFEAKHLRQSFEKMSGGERMRAALILLTTQEKKPDLLLLDEPTNHLDLQTRKALSVALAKLRCALIVVSHDEDFLKDLEIGGHIELMRSPLDEPC